MKTKKAKAVKEARKPTKQTQVKSKSARAHIAEGTRLFALAGRPTKAQFVLARYPGVFTIGSHKPTNRRNRRQFYEKTVSPPLHIATRLEKWT